ncbi:MAG: Stk1 family PASTA domain-containing Ser/Thr kinase [Oscillibacter sp.]|nr:Stk1 family PASTA domain-containing Ser/Thr kinase [Oscillibacter sp.]
MDPYIGKMLDNRYEILERIGTGGMAIVYKAKCHRLNRLVAIKILKSDLAQDEDFRRRFNAESQAVAQLSHPNIVSVYDVSHGGDSEYIVMELIDGITLKQYMEKRGKLNWREALHFITQIMRGLSHAHSRGIIHRDIKPQNVMVLRDGSVRVADFGIACLEDSSQTITQEALGSVHYISPEQARGDRPDARSDIYSAGIVLYEMLTGRLPFEGESAVSVAIQHLSSIPLAPREINADIPEQMELICMKAMAPDLDKRYASADDMIADLDKFRKNPEVEMDFELSDLQEEETDEPTMAIHTVGGHATNLNPSRQDHHHGRYEETEVTDPPMSKRRTILVAAIAIAALAVVALLFSSIMNSFKTPASDQYMVPEVLNLTLEEAMNLPEVNGIFEIQEAENEIFSEDYSEGRIAKQEPSAGEYRKGNQLVIKVWISAGEDKGEMLDVTEKTVTEAMVKLKQLKEKYGVTFDTSETYQQYSDVVEEGKIIATIPAAHEAVKKGETIILVVSKGPERKPIMVPRFIGQNISDVLPQLEAYKLICNEEDMIEVLSDQPAGTIISQSIDPLTQAFEGDSIRFEISSGLTAAQMPVSFNLPQDGRATVKVEVYVGDESTPQSYGTAYCSNYYYTAMLTGSGTQMIRVYFDGELDISQSHELQFN